MRPATYVEEASDSENENDDKNENEDDLLEIDLKKPEPLSKKQKRLLKKGKINEDKSGLVKATKKARKLHESMDDLVETGEASETEEAAKDSETTASKSKKSEFSVWIGNLSFDTTVEDIKRFIVAKTTSNKETETAPVVVTEKDLSRVKLPLAPAHNRGSKGKSGKIRGFAYVDLKNQNQVDTVVGLSEEYLNGRNLLIKDSRSFEGRPAVVTASGSTKGAAISKNPPSRILFVGNLAFDTTETALEEHFQHCGDITKIRMATFEDSGNCKGFAFVDFRDVDGATEALKDKSCRKLGGRFLRMEFGEDRSQRTKQEKFKSRNSGYSNEDGAETAEHGAGADTSYSQSKSTDTGYDNYQERPKRKHDSRHSGNDRKSQSIGPNKRLKPGLALATAQRAKPSIVPSAGKKITFD